MNDDNLDSSFNMNFVDLTGGGEEEDGGGGSAILDTDHRIIQEYDHSTKNNKYNSFPMRQKKAGNKLKPTPRSTSSIQPPPSSNAPPASNNTQKCINLGLEELLLTVKLANTRSQEATRLKNLIRNNSWPMDHSIRKYLWKCLILELLAPPSYKENNKHRGLSVDPSEYNQNLNTVFGKTQDIELSLPEFVYTSETTSESSSSGGNNHLNYYYLNTSGRQAIKRILCVYEYHYPHVTYNPGLLSICSLLLHYMQEHEVFSALCFMSSSKEHFIESKAAWDTASSVFIRLTKSYCKSSYEIILKYATDSPEAIFNDWYWWIFDCLSFDYQVKIMDCYLFEGLKVLYRVSLAIVQLFSKFVKSSSIKVSKDSIKQFLESSQIESIEKLLKVSFSIRNLKRSTIKDFYTKEEVKRKAFGAGSGGGGGGVGSNNTSPFQQPLSVSTADNQLKPVNSLENNQYSPTRIYLNDAKTSILSHNQLYTLWTWIPQRLTVYSPNMLFTTQEHGTSVNTLFNVIDELEYCFIVVKTFSDEIFGAFCAGMWNERKQKKLYFGTGETFLFTLAPQKKQYKWVANKYEKLTGSQELFMRADSNKLVIGGGGKDGLSISSNLIEGTTSRCETFENEPLCSTSQFQIAILEVVAFGQGR